MRKLLVASVLAAAFAALAAGSAFAWSSPTPSGAVTFGSGSATLVSDVSDTSTANDASSLTWTMPTGTTFADLKTLSASYDITAGGCGGGSPRFQIALSSGKNVFVYFGPSPSFTGCPLNTWQSTGNLIGNADQGRYDTSQVQAGTQSSTYPAALALLGSQQVTSVSLVVDSGWFFPGKVQTVMVRDVDITTTSTAGPSQMNPARTCRDEEQSMGLKAFDEHWGTNGNDRNAFGKCVSAHATGEEHHVSQAMKTTVVKHAKRVHEDRGNGDDRHHRS